MAQRDDRETFDPDASPEEETKKIRRARRARADLDPEEGPLFYVRLLYDLDMPDLPAAMRFLRKHGLSVPDVKLSAVAVWGSLLLKAMRGSEKAQMYLLDRALGVPDKPYADRAEEMTREEVDAEMRGIVAALGTNPQDLDATIARLTARGEM